MTTRLCRKVAGFAAVLLWGLGALEARGQELSFDALKSELEYVLELITKRQLSDDELGRAAREFYTLMDDHCGPRCIDAVAGNKRLVEPMATQPGSPRDLLARQWYSRELYYSPTQAGSFIQSLTNEVDPIRLADRKSNRVMTHGDFLGLMNINYFLHHGGEPTERAFAAAEVEDHIAVLHQRYVEGQLSLPYRAVLAVELWTGLRQNWRKLNRDQKNAVVAYLSDKEFKARLDVSTCQVLLGMPHEEALVFQRDIHAAQNEARLQWITLRTMLVGEAATDVQIRGKYCYFCP